MRRQSNAARDLVAFSCWPSRRACRRRSPRRVAPHARRARSRAASTPAIAWPSSSARQDAAPRLPSARRDAAAQPQIVRRGGYTRTNHVDEFGIRGRQRRHARRSSTPTCRTTTARASTCSGRSTPAGASTRSSARRSAEADAIGRDVAAARTDLRLEITRAFWAVVTAREAGARASSESLARMDAHLADVRNRLEGRPRAAERRAVDAKRSARGSRCC